MSEINSETFPNITQYDSFLSLLHWQIESYYLSNTYFSFAVLSFEVVDDKKLLHQRDNVAKFISASINKCINSKSDFYSFKYNEFLIVFPDRMTRTSLNLLNKVNQVVREKYKNDVIITYSISECPIDGSSFTELYKTAKNKLTTATQDSNGSYIEKSKSWQAEINNSLQDIETNVKHYLFTELKGLIELINSYDAYLGEHSALVSQGAILLAKEMGYSWQDVEKIAVAALLHDIGYTAIPKEIFNKSHPLTLEERKLIQLHPTIACEHILKPLPFLHEYIPFIQNHHELLDGSGYPKGKKGDQVPIGAQIISIVDTYHAMKSERPYRQAKPFNEIIEFYIRNAGIKWNEELITIFTALIADDIVREKFSEIDEVNLSLLKRELTK